MKPILFAQEILISMDSPFGFFLTYVYLFILGSFLGWCAEILFRRFVSMKRWINPGFLKGPCLPLYGFGLCVLHLISDLCFKYLVKEGTYPDFYSLSYEDFGATQGNLNFYVVSVIAILIIGISLTLIEFIAGLIFIKGLHIKLWDYSKMKGNIMGVICPLFSFIWLVGGAIYWFALRPFVSYAIGFLNNHAWVLTFFIGAYIALFIVDFASSLKLSLQLSKDAKVKQAILDYEKFKLSLKSQPVKEKKKSAIQVALEDSLAPVTKKIKEVKDEVVSHLYINNEIPTKNESETPRTKEEKEKENQNNENNSNNS